MSMRLRTFGALFPIILLLFLSLPLLSLSPEGKRKSVFVVVIDGVRYSETFGDSTHAHIPRMWELAKKSASVISAFYNDSLTQTVPGHSSIATGTWQRITNDGKERPDSPTFFEYLRKENPGINKEEVWMIAGKTKLEAVTHSTSREYGSDYEASSDIPSAAGYWSDVETWSALRAVMRKHHPRLVLVNFPDVDISGHRGEWKTYLSSIRTVDSLAYEIWKEIQTDAFYRGGSTIFITGDHGRHDDAHGGFKSHGDWCEGCRHLIFLAAGPRIKEGFVSSTRRTQIDVCPTVGRILGFKTPQADGKLMSEIMKN